MSLPHLEKLLPPAQCLVRPANAQVRQIYIHHTVSGTAASALNWWKQTPQRIGTEWIIDRDGTVIRAMLPGMFAFHLGTGSRSLEEQSIGIELVSWGPLIAPAGQYIAGPRKPAIPESEVVELGWRGYTHWQDYTEAQMKSLEALLNWQCFLYDIPRTRQDIMDVSPAALRGEPGIWSHASVRADKSDAAPLPSLLMCLDAVAGR